MQLCRGKKSDGSSCQARRRTGSEFCFFHDPKLTKERRQAQQKGGSKGKALLVLSPPPADFDLTVPEGMLSAVQHAFNLLVRREIDARTAYTMSHLAESARKIFETTSLNKRLEREEDSRAQEALESGDEEESAAVRIFKVAMHYD